MTARRRRTFAASSPEEVWEVACDPEHLARWWPRVDRVESADSAGFTQVMRSARGKTVRADFRVAERARPRSCRWVQELEGTPFERLLARSEIAISLAPGTEVTLEISRTMRGLSRFGGFMVRRAAHRQLEEALDNLERICG